MQVKRHVVIRNKICISTGSDVVFLLGDQVLTLLLPKDYNPIGKSEKEILSMTKSKL